MNRRELGRLAAAAIAAAPLLDGCAAAASGSGTPANPRWAGVRRYVVGTGRDGKSHTQSAQDIPVQQQGTGGTGPGLLWVTDTMPVDNAAAVTADGAPGGGTGPFKTMPGPDGTVFSFIYAPHGDTLAPSAPAGLPSGYAAAGGPAARSGKHRTNSLDYWVILDGEITLATDADEIHLKPGDTLVIRGASHAWVKASDKPYLAVTVSVDARPLQG